jgi:hypothetical protein
MFSVLREFPKKGVGFGEQLRISLLKGTSSGYPALFQFVCSLRREVLQS